MSEPTAADIPLEVASITDRGLSQKRPLNEDSYLADAQRRIFAVADGVGGAEAGEVASQTAIEVLEEAFKHHRNGDDVEDLMEIAIQRANASIHQLSREHAKLSMMATTLVALHLDGMRATIGHVGDSRLYRLTTDGRIHRETDDHSVVEEEVRAGRMTPEQAANHPSRNVISRALGAEPSVDVDLKTIEVERGTTFLLCSDGITRHIPDEELNTILNSSATLEAACEEMKRRCFERGAEDNLTAVVVRVGEAAAGADTSRTNADEDDEAPTIISTRAEAPLVSPRSNEAVNAASVLRRPFSDVGTATVDAPPPPPRAEVLEANGAPVTAEAATPADTTNSTERASSSSAARFVVLLFFLVAASALGFYTGMLYAQRSAPETATAQTPAPVTSQTPAQADPAEETFEERRRRVDRNPLAEANRLGEQINARQIGADDPVTLYFYGRALFLSGRQQEAVDAFDKAVTLIDRNTTPENAELKIESLLATAAAKLRTEDVEGARRSVRALDEMFRADESASEPQQPLTDASPAATPQP
ncbi:MAG TPA: PP2C family serine/threonine-protein phosphatase [Pyrinomonadaceae bacterium]|nr:PP2C family serine/threonine-protein phosphatase [Pyrinomonadaceae bacterium]